MEADLGIENSTKYNTALTIFFVPYIIFEIPSNILLKKLKPHVWCTCRISLNVIFVADGFSVRVYVHVRYRHDLPGLGHKLGWTDDHPLVLG